MDKSKLWLVGLIGTAVTALCCFTSVLVLAFTAAGLSAAVAYLDVVLLPALAAFLLLTGYGVWYRWLR